jgi:hypothetical protein
MKPHAIVALPAAAPIFAPSADADPLSAVSNKQPSSDGAVVTDP